MKIGYLVNPSCSVSGMGNGVLKQAAKWREGLRLLGHTAEFVGPKGDGSIDGIRSYDLIHFFQHGYWLREFLGEKPPGQKWLLSPILDSVASPTLYGAIARLPLRHRLFVVGPQLLKDFAGNAGVCVRSEYEWQYLRRVVSASRVVKVPIALSMDDGSDERPSFDIPRDFALFVGAVFSERKNVLRLIDACEGIDVPLVVVGNQANTVYMARVVEKAKGARVPILLPAFVQDRELRWLYRNCSVFCLPSLIEGVGQAAVEALSMGARVVATKVGGSREYLGSFATYVDPNDVRAIERGLRDALAKEKPAWGAVRGHMERFKKERVAEVLYKCYQEAVA